MSKFKISEDKLRQIIREELERSGMADLLAEKGAVGKAFKWLTKSEEDVSAADHDALVAQALKQFDVDEAELEKIAKAAKNQLDQPAHQIPRDVSVTVDGSKVTDRNLIVLALKAFQP